MRVKAVINLNNFEYNLKQILNKVDNKKIMAIIKANAYGHGDKKIFLKSIEMGISFFGVATEHEALRLLKLNKDVNILILSPVEKRKIKKLAKLGLHLSISSFEDIKYILKENIKGNFHLALDTGMGRIGFNKDNIDEAIKLLNPIGIFSHLSFADDKNSSLKQKRIFDEIVKKYNIKYKHLLNSIGFLKYFDDSYDLNRVGIVLYGLENENFKPVMSVYARVNNVKKLNEDTNIGYNNTYTAKKGEYIATISAGYADGINRALSNKGKVYFKGRLYNIIGNICMDQFMILADESIKVNDYVEIFGENISVKSIAKKINTISYEIVCNISNRVKRIYKEDKK